MEMEQEIVTEVQPAPEVVPIETLPIPEINLDPPQIPTNLDPPQIPTNLDLPQIDHGRILYKSCRKNSCEAEELALSFISDIHHPVVSCFRDLTKQDFYTIFHNSRFKEGATNLEQCLICIGLMDYIATTLKNPFYENLGRSLTSIKVYVKKMFQELRRTLRDWASTDFIEFTRCKELIIKYLRGLTPFFKAINYDVCFSSALSLLAREKYRKKKSISRPKFIRPDGLPEERSALMEIATNVDKTQEDESVQDKDSDDKDQEPDGDDMFDILDDGDSPKEEESPPPPIAAPIFNTKSKKSKVLGNQGKKPKPSMLFRNPFISQAQSTGTENNNVLNKESANISMGVKRPSVDELESPAKKVCIDISCDNPTSPMITSSPKPPVKNAFEFLMNRQKEIFKHDKLKKGKTTTTPKSKSVRS